MLGVPQKMQRCLGSPGGCRGRGVPPPHVLCVSQTGFQPQRKPVCRMCFGSRRLRGQRALVRKGRLASCHSAIVLTLLFTACAVQAEKGKLPSEPPSLLVLPAALGIRSLAPRTFQEAQPP